MGIGHVLHILQQRIQIHRANYKFLYVCILHGSITQYGSIVYIGIAMVFVFSPYIRKFSSYCLFQVNLTSDDFTA